MDEEVKDRVQVNSVNTSWPWYSPGSPRPDADRMASKLRMLPVFIVCMYLRNFSLVSTLNHCQNACRIRRRATRVRFFLNEPNERNQ